ncbi:hypothetical protein [Mumia sp. DW29H23]|uniref:hypothetical protein n=1 Tax=Mumia sp. DW29H23 TaxID=3421241 RepID=UPI003D6862D1
MADIITGDDLAAYLPGRNVVPDSATTTLYVELANGIVSEVTGEIFPVPVRIRAITLEVAARGLRDADGYTSVTTAFDDTSRTVRREGAGEDLGVYLTDEERDEIVDILSGRPRRRAGTIRLGVARP